MAEVKQWWKWIALGIAVLLISVFPDVLERYQ